jgi:hypothetical protein
MRYLIVLLIHLLSITDMSAQKKKVRRTPSQVMVTLHITQTVWCGGARPTEEMEKEFNTPKPYPNYNLLFVRIAMICLRIRSILSKPMRVANSL